ncbi:hypothetical protein BN2364_1343 [Alloalcanivorax xenomutans]|nr:hypothetical protein BN2364_1343 [Alloalcanivorax xenomutans]
MPRQPDSAIRLILLRFCCYSALSGNSFTIVVSAHYSYLRIAGREQ